MRLIGNREACGAAGVAHQRLRTALPIVADQARHEIAAHLPHEDDEAEPERDHQAGGWDAKQPVRVTMSYPGHRHSDDESQGDLQEAFEGVEADRAVAQTQGDEQHRQNAEKSEEEIRRRRAGFLHWRHWRAICRQ